MKKVEIDNILVEEETFDLEKYINHPLIQKKTKELNLTKKQIIEGIIPIIEYLEKHSSCDNCTGLSCCNKNSIGFVYNIFLNSANEINGTYEPCLHLRNYKNMKKHILVNYYPDHFDKVSTEIFIKLNSNMRKIINHFFKNYQQQSFFYFFEKATLQDSEIFATIANIIALNNTTVSCIKTREYNEDYKAGFNDYKQIEFLKKVVKEAELLIIDNFGEENITNWSFNTIFAAIIDSRIISNKTTFILTQFSLNDLANRINEKLSDKILVDSVFNKIKQNFRVINLMI